MQWWASSGKEHAPLCGYLPNRMCRRVSHSRPIVALRVPCGDGRPSAFPSLIQCPQFSVYLVLPWQPLSARLLFSPSQRPRWLPSLSTSIHTGSPWVAVPALLDRCGMQSGARVVLGPGIHAAQDDQPLCPVYAPPGHSNLLSSQDVRCRPACADTIPPGHQGQVVDVQSTNSNAPCYTPPMCSDSYPLGFLGTIIPIQSTDPNAACYLAPMCRGQAPPGYLGRIIPVQSTYPGGDCYLPPICELPPRPGYLGQIIPVQSTDQNADCYIPPVCPLDTVRDEAGQCVSCFEFACTPPPPLCFDDAPTGYFGIVIPMQSTDRDAECFVEPPPLCADEAPMGSMDYLGAIIPMQSTDPNAVCYLEPPPPLLACTAFAWNDLVTNNSRCAFATEVPGLSISFSFGRGHGDWFRVSWPGHEGELVQVGVEHRDSYGRHSDVSQTHVMGETGWSFSDGRPLDAGIASHRDHFAGPWVTDAYANHTLVSVNTLDGHACYYAFERENYGGTPEPLSKLPWEVDCTHFHDGLPTTGPDDIGTQPRTHAHEDRWAHSHPGLLADIQHCAPSPASCTHTHPTTVHGDRGSYTGIPVTHEHANLGAHPHQIYRADRSYNSASCASPPSGGCSHTHPVEYYDSNSRGPDWMFTSSTVTHEHYTSQAHIHSLSSTWRHGSGGGSCSP